MVAPSGPKAQATSPMSIELQGTLLHSDAVISYRSSPCCIGEIVTLATCASCTLWISDTRDIPCVFLRCGVPLIFGDWLSGPAYVSNIIRAFLLPPLVEATYEQLYKTHVSAEAL